MRREGLDVWVGNQPVDPISSIFDKNQGSDVAEKPRNQAGEESTEPVSVVYLAEASEDSGVLHLPPNELNHAATHDD